MLGTNLGTSTKQRFCGSYCRLNKYLQSSMNSCNSTPLMAALHVIITTGSLTLLVFVNVLRFVIQGIGFSIFAILAGVLEMIARTVAGLVFIPAFDFVGACVASPFAWLLADCFLIPAFFYVMRRLEKNISI